MTTVIITIYIYTQILIHQLFSLITIVNNSPQLKGKTPRLVLGHPWPLAVQSSERLRSRWPVEVLGPEVVTFGGLPK